MSDAERRAEPDRRRVPRGGRRPYDRPGRYPLVLVADSFDVVRRSCVQYLDRLNFEVVQATTHEDVTVLMSMSAPRLILAARTLRGGAAKAHWMEAAHSGSIPTIVIANVDGPTMPVPGTDGLLRRPFTQTEMIAEVRRVLQATARSYTSQKASSTRTGLHTPKSGVRTPRSSTDLRKPSTSTRTPWGSA